MSVTFHVVRFTPDPEEIEPVNVALLLLGDRPRLLVEDAFPRLKCIAPGTDLELLRFYLSALGQRLADGTPADKWSLGMSSQVILMAPKHLASRPSADVERMLLDRYLRKRRGDAPLAAALRETRKRIEGQLDHLLFETLRVPPVMVQKRAAPSAFLSSETYQALGANGVTFARAIRGPSSLVLIDGVDLGLKTARVELHAQHVAAGFHRLGKIRADLKRIESVDLARAAILFGDEPPRGQARFEFLVEMLKGQSDYLERGDNLSQLFVRAVEQATPRFA